MPSGNFLSHILDRAKTSSTSTWDALSPIVKQMQRDPSHAPEIMARGAVTSLQPIAIARSRRHRTMMPIATVAVSGASGFGGLAGLPVSIVSLWWAEAEIAFRVAHQYAPHRTDDQLAGDLLHLWGIVDDPAGAQAIIRGDAKPLWRNWAQSNSWTLGKLLIKVAMRRGGKKALAARGASRGTPGIAVAVNAWSSARQLSKFSKQAKRYYRGNLPQ